MLVALIATRTKVPLLVGFLGLGMLLGSEGPGGIDFDDPALARGIGVAALAAILYEGGLTTAWRDVRRVVGPAAVLATVGVAVTAGVTGVAAYLLFDLSFTTALLVGAVVGSTDAAAVFLTLRTSTLRRRTAALLEVESGANDPMAVALSIGLIAVLTTPDYSGGDFALFLAAQLGVGAIGGLVFGWLAVQGIARLPASMGAFAPVASVGLAALAFGTTDAVGGSGFLAIYMVGLRVGNTPSSFRGVLIAFHQGMAYIAQVVLFVALGLLVFPSELGPVVLPGLALAAALILVARPIAVVISLVGQGFGRRETALVSWAGLRGAVPIVLATFPPTEGVADSDTIFNAVFFVVLASSLVQGPTLEPLARRLRLTTEEGPHYRPALEVGAVEGADLVEYTVGPGDAIVGRRVRELALPRTALVAVIVRAGEAVPPRGRTVVEGGDRLYVMARTDSRGPLERLLEQWEHGPMPEPAPAVTAPAITGETGGEWPGAREVYTLEMSAGARLKVEAEAGGTVVIRRTAAPEPDGEARLTAEQARSLGQELVGPRTRARAKWLVRTPLPGIGERLRIEGPDGPVFLIVNRIEAVRELLTGAPDHRRLAVLNDEEAHRLGALLLAAGRGSTAP